MERFGVASEYSLATATGRRQLAAHLMDKVALDHSQVAERLSMDLVERLEQTLGGLEYLNDPGGAADIDRNLQYPQFWRDKGIGLAKSGIREPQLEEAFKKWQSEGRAKYTLHRILRWKRQAEALTRSHSAPRA